MVSRRGGELRGSDKAVEKRMSRKRLGPLQKKHGRRQAMMAGAASEYLSRGSGEGTGME